MKTIGTFQSKLWGPATALRATYGRADGPTAVLLQSAEGEPLATLSVNMQRPECSHDSTALPADCFYVKHWGGNEEIAAEVLASGLFVLREDLGTARSGFITSPVWQIAAPGAAS